MKSVLISIRPRWCELIAGGKKTVEIRKTCPQISTPFKCYIYCTKRKNDEDINIIPFDNGRRFYAIPDCKVIGEFVCDRIFEICMTDEGYDFDVPKATGLKYEEMEAYLDRKNGYGWHISDLVIYDKPKKLSEFKRHDPTYDFSVFGEVSRTYSINRPPQSWCYVESLEGGTDNA